MKIMRLQQDKVGLAAGILWLLTLQYFVMQTVVALQWPTPFSLKENAISDLGAVMCGQFQDRYVCSPWFGAMNISFVVLGLLMIGGGYAMYRYYGSAKSGFMMIALSGIGAVLVGLFPEDTVSSLHIAGAVLSFVPGGLGLVWCGLKMGWARWLRTVSVGFGTLSLVSLAVLTLGMYGSIGFGTVERLVSYPIVTWLMIVGTYTLYRSVRSA